jgi:hypothetical protein
VICRGKTVSCEADLRGHDARAVRSGRLFLIHQENGWTKATVASQYLDWLSGQQKAPPLFLVWDCFSTQRDAGVKIINRTQYASSEMI